MSIKTILMAAAVSAVTATSAMAVTLVEQYEATSAVGSGADHSMWLAPGVSHTYNIGQDFDFSPAGTFSLFSDGSAKLEGRVVSQSNKDAGFDLSFMYDNTFLQKPAFKSENGSKATPETRFLDLESGILEGFGLLKGLTLMVSRLPVDGKYATQFGPSNGDDNGPNNKNTNDGLAGWFKIKVVSNECKICNYWTKKKLNYAQGDINIDLDGGPVGGEVPLPASGLLLIGGLAGLAGIRRKRRAA